MHTFYTQSKKQLASEIICSCVEFEIAKCVFLINTWICCDSIYQW